MIETSNGMPYSPAMLTVSTMVMIKAIIFTSCKFLRLAHRASQALALV